MGLWKIDNVSSEEWSRRMMRRHRIMTALEFVLLIALCVGMWFLVIWASDLMHP